MSPDWREDPLVDPDDPAAVERARRRAEREEKRRRKAEKEGRKEAKEPPPEPPPPAPAPPPRTPDEEFWDERPEPAPEPEPPVAEPEPTAESRRPAEPEPAAESRRPAEPELAAGAEPEPAGETEPSPRAAAESVASEPPPEPEPRFEPEPVAEAEDAEFWAFEDEGDPALAAGDGGDGDGSRGRDGGAEGGGGGVVGALRRHPFRIAAAIIAILALWFLNALFQPLHGDGGGKVQVQVPKGSSVSEVGDLLSEKGVIDNSTLFQIRVTLADKRSELYAGNFTLAAGMSYGDAIEALATPPVKRTLSVTIPEGYSRPEAAQLVREDGIPGRYMRATKSSKFLDPADYGGGKARNLEGFLFPNTFELKPNAPVADLVELQLKDFKRQIKKVNMGYARSKNLTVYDVLIIASMVEDEAGVPGQRRLVASVVYNRLREGMPLGIDATIRFATGNWTEPLTESELAIDSPYNTRTNQGLPPGPINSPGLAAIKAAARPKQTDFLFYVTDPKGCNELTFATNEAEFEDAVAAYNRAREEAGGNAPNTCGE